MKKHFSIWMFLAIVVLLPMGVFGIVKWYEHTYTRLPVLGGNDHTIANYQLVNQYGKTSSQAEWQGKITVNNFFFTHCPSICPKMIRNLKKVQQLYANDPSILVNSFTVDPERDSVGQLKSYATKMDIQNNWQLITGEKKEIYKLARKSFLVVATDGDGGPNDFIHSELLVLVDKAKRIRGFYNGTDDAEVNNLLRDIKRLEKEYSR
jgi:protein SCO1/2